MPSGLPIRKRWALIDRHVFGGESMRDVARELSCSVRTVERIVKLYKESGDVTERARRGQPARLDGTARETLDAALTSTPRATNQELIDYLRRHGAPSFSLRTLQRTRKQLGWYRIKDRVRVELTASQRRARLEFAAANRDRNWKLVVFSDEKPFDITSSDYVWVKKGQSRPERTVRSIHAKVMVWGAIWYTGRSTLAFTTAKINSVKYQSILATHLLPSAPLTSRFLFQQDNAPPHVSASTRAWLSEYAVPLFPSWPANSPDCNPIESVWAWMQREVNGWRCRTMPELRAAVERAWISIPQATIQAYFALPSWPTRHRSNDSSLTRTHQVHSGTSTCTVTPPHGMMPYD